MPKVNVYGLVQIRDDGFPFTIKDKTGKNPDIEGRFRKLGPFDIGSANAAGREARATHVTGYGDPDKDGYKKPKPIVTADGELSFDLHVAQSAAQICHAQIGDPDEHYTMIEMLVLFSIRGYGESLAALLDKIVFDDPEEDEHLPNDQRDGDAA